MAPGAAQADANIRGPSEVLAGVSVHTGRVFRRDGRRLAYATFGKPDAPCKATILHHHFTGSCRLEAAALARIARAHHVRVLAIDRPGAGDSDPRESAALEDWTADALAVADALCIERFAVSGSAGGAAYALALALRAPRRVSSLLLAGPLPDPGHPANGRQPWWTRLALKLFLRPGPIRFSIEQFLRDPDRYVDSSIFMSDHDRASLGGVYRDLSRRLLADGVRQGFEGLSEELRLLSRPWALDWNALHPPLRVFCSSSDPLVHYARALGSMQPGARYMELPGGRVGALSPRYCDAMIRAALEAAPSGST